MTQPATSAVPIARFSTPPPRGVLGLVDDLLDVCQTRNVRLEFSDGRCFVTAPNDESSTTIDVPLTKSVFRAVLARVAVLCNERTPGSVSPYGGDGELAAPGQPEVTLIVSFANTPAEQRLDVRRREHLAGAARTTFTVPTRADRHGVDTVVGGAATLEDRP